MSNQDQPKGQAELTEAQNEWHDVNIVMMPDDGSAQLEIKFESGLVIDYYDEWPMEIATHWRFKSNHVEEQPKEKAYNGFENKDAVVDILNKRIKDSFSSSYQTFERKEVEQAVEAIIRLIPPSYFESLDVTAPKSEEMETGWISVEERLPEFNMGVMVYCKIYGRFCANYVQIDDTRWGEWKDWQGQPILQPTHWMPLPAPPKQ